MTEWLAQHLLVVLVVVSCYFLFSAAAGAMLPPVAGKERGLYGWFYRFVQRLAANADRFYEAQYKRLLYQSGLAGGTPVVGAGVGSDAGSATVVAAERVEQRTTEIAVQRQG